MFGQMAAKRVDRLRSLPNEKIPGAKHHGLRLLVLGLDGDEAHGRPRRRLGNGFGICRIVLLPLDKGLHIDRRDQPDLMA